MSRARVLMLPVSDARGASTRYRVLAHLPALEAGGLEARVRFPMELRHGAGARRVLRTADMFRDLYGPGEENLLFVHRKTYLPGFADRLRRPGRPVVYDMDDAVDLPPPGADPGDAERQRYRTNFEATVQAADVVLCGNEFLASRLPHGRYEILPTPIDTTRFRPGAVSPGPGATLGWVGYSDNLPYLEALAEPLREVSRRHPDLRLVVVADREPEIPGVQVEFREWRLEDEIACFAGIDVGLMPLEDSPWARGKCAFKAIQYMALGIPAVASPVGMNAEVIRDGDNGFLPADAASWVNALDSLLSDHALRGAIGAAGRETIEHSYSLAIVSRALVGILRGQLGE